MKAPLWKTLDREVKKKLIPAQKKRKKKKVKIEMSNGWIGRKGIV